MERKHTSCNGALTNLQVEQGAFSANQNVFLSIIIPSPREYVSKSSPFSLKTEQEVPCQQYDHLTYPHENDVNTVQTLAAQTNHKTSRFQKHAFSRSYKCAAFQ